MRILILEDNPADAELTLRQIRQEITSFDIDMAHDRLSFLEKLNNDPDIILADYALPQFTALDALQLIQVQGRDIPLIIVSGTIGEEVAVEAMRLGATDYLLKDRLIRLNAAVFRALEEAKNRRARRTAEMALRESEARYRSLFENSPISLWEEDFSKVKVELERLSSQGVTDLRQYYIDNPQALTDLIALRRILAVNHATLRMYQCEEDPLAIEKLSQLFSDVSRRHFLEELIVFYNGNQSFARESRHLTLTGEELYVSLNATLAPGHEDTWDKVFTTVVDITERKRSADTLRQLNETLESRVRERTLALEKTTRDLALLKDQLETILQNSPDGFLLLDGQGVIQQVNQGFLRMSGLRESDLAGKVFGPHLAAVGIHAAQTALREAIEDQHPVSIEGQIRHLHGKDIDCAINMIPVHESGQLSAVVINVHDVTGMKEVQRMKDAFVSNVSHELRTPITNFICNLELLRMRPENTAVYLDRLDRETNHLKNLIEDLLNLSRLDQAAIGVGKTQVNLTTLCAGFTELRQPLADAKGLSLSFEQTQEDCTVFADEGLISQVLSILLTNAINYTPTGGEVVVSTVKAEGVVGFAVRDTGPGITAEDQNRITQRFYRGKVGQDSGVSGTGLGLSIAVEILSLHDGRLQIISDGLPGHGATFIAWLPDGSD
ncbi:MAG: PAS domain S-box protein [Anaerolineae bacterium]|nr:PAS domain S-box protein [Anaerolineae bacterium]